MRKPTFCTEINWGHILTATTMVVTGLGLFFAMRGDIIVIKNAVSSVESKSIETAKRLEVYQTTVEQKLEAYRERTDLLFYKVFPLDTYTPHKTVSPKATDSKP